MIMPYYGPSVVVVVGCCRDCSRSFKLLVLVVVMEVECRMSNVKLYANGNHIFLVITMPVSYSNTSVQV